MRSQSTFLRKLLTISLPFVSLLLLFLTSEIGVRFYHYLRWNMSIIDGRSLTNEAPKISSITVDPDLGWRATENYRFTGKRYSIDGTEYMATISQDRNGFRMYGDPSSGRPRIFVIGDSFTQAVEVSDDKAYYAVLKETLDAEVFAYGGGGYGSLQEYMVFDKHFDEIKPDLVLWQYSTNDIINNSPDLELASTINNNGMLRPYLIGDQVRNILPKHNVANVRATAVRYCRTCYMVLNRLDRLRARWPADSVETKTSTTGPSHGLFLEALHTTDVVMRKVRMRAGTTPIVAFVVGTGDPYGPEYEQGLAEISSHSGIGLLKDVDATVLAAEKEGQVLRSDDGAHWNEAGHYIVGRAIADGLGHLLPKLFVIRAQESRTLISTDQIH